MDHEEFRRIRQGRIDTMRVGAAKWLREHPRANVGIVYGAPKGFKPEEVVGTISVGLDSKFVTPNEDGLALIRYLMGLFPKQIEPTISMVREAIDQAMRETGRA